jgi:hypothetical protein
MKKQSLREETDRKAGGQHGHEGRTLQCSTVIDTIVDISQTIATAADKI